MTQPSLREQALRDAYWAHREVPGRHRGECCQDPCFADITERWVALVTERASGAETHTTTEGGRAMTDDTRPDPCSHPESALTSNEDLGAGELAERILAHPKVRDAGDAGGGLDGALKAVEAALPEGAWIEMVCGVVEVPAGRCIAFAKVATEHSTRAHRHGQGPTLTAALDVLRVALANTGSDSDGR